MSPSETLTIMGDTVSIKRRGVDSESIPQEYSLLSFSKVPYLSR